MSGSGSDVLATEEGGRRLCRDVRRGLGTRRKHKNANEMSRRLRKSEEKVGKSLTVAKTRQRRIAFGVDRGGENRRKLRGGWRSVEVGVAGEAEDAI